MIDIFDDWMLENGKPDYESWREKLQRSGMFSDLQITAFMEVFTAMDERHEKIVDELTSLRSRVAQLELFTATDKNPGTEGGKDNG